MKNWYALDINGKIIKIENVNNFGEADEKAPDTIWIADNDSAKDWCDSLAEEFIKPYLIRMLERGKHRTDGNTVELLERLEHMVNGDHDLHAMNKTHISMLENYIKELKGK